MQATREWENYYYDWIANIFINLCSFFKLLASKSLQNQDYIFVREFVCFLATVMLITLKNSIREIDVVLGVLAVLDQVISCLRKEALNREVNV